MALLAGTRLGSYEIVAPLGAGGMGEVYRARDAKLERDIAIKILPSEVAADPERLLRFKQEARAVSSLNHPAIVHVYDVDSSESTPYIAMELVEGRSLKDLLASGGLLPTKRLLDIAIEIADGLAKAHGLGIVHRDLKPDNLMVTREGHVKILDFGLAKLAEAGGEASGEGSTATHLQSRSGQILGTVGYMSPEQASGQAVDFRSDQFSLGVLLYEMASGRRAFRGRSASETLAAILRDQPEPLSRANPDVPLMIRRIVEERCLAKDPQERYASTWDLLRDLRWSRDHWSEEAEGIRVRPSRGPWLFGGIGLVALLALAGSLFVAWNHRAPPLPTFRPLTFRAGTIWSARFAPDGQTIIYGMAAGGRPVELFLTRSESPESRPLGFPGTDILSISRSAEMAISLGREYRGGWVYTGTLARAPLAGGAARPILEDVTEADWSPDGDALAVVRGPTSNVLEFPVGKVVYKSPGWISHPRVSPKGNRVAFLDHPLEGSDAGSVAVVDRGGVKQTLSQEWGGGAVGLAWSPSGDEILFTAVESGNAHALHALTLSGSNRLLLRVPGGVAIQDVSADGRILLTHETWRCGIAGLPPGETRERDFSWLDWSVLTDLSADGRRLLSIEQGVGSGPDGDTYLRATDGSPAVRLGPGYGGALSPDGKWVLTVLPSSRTQLLLVPTGAGEPRRLPATGLSYQTGGTWLPDGRGILCNANEGTHGARVYVQDLEGGKPRAITPERVPVPLGFHPVSPDGRLVAAIAPDGKGYLYPIDGGEARPLKSLEPGERPASWSDDGHSLFVFRPGPPPLTVYRLDVASGRREAWKEIAPADPSGMVAIPRIRLTADGKHYVYNYRRILSALYVVEGLK